MFNALKYSKELEDAGFTRQQAEITIGVFFQFMDHEFSTKKDLLDVRSELKTDIQALRAEILALKHDIKALEYRMTVKFGAMQVASVVFLATFMKLF